MLKIGVSYKSTAETLANLGLPPNRREGNQGFLVHPVDGRIVAPFLPSSRERSWSIQIRLPETTCKREEGDGSIRRRQQPRDGSHDGRPV